jgi:hypothetical protein
MAALLNQDNEAARHRDRAARRWVARFESAAAYAAYLAAGWLDEPKPLEPVPTQPVTLI